MFESVLFEGCFSNYYTKFEFGEQGLGISE